MPDWSDSKLAIATMRYFTGQDRQNTHNRKPRSNHPDQGALAYLAGSHETYDHDYVSRLPIHGKAKPKRHRGKHAPDSQNEGASPTTEPQSMNEQYHHNQMPPPRAASTYAPPRQDMSGQYIPPAGEQQQQQYPYSQRRHRGYQGSMNGFEMGGDDDEYESVARGYPGPPPRRGEGLTEGQDYPPPNGPNMSSAPQRESMSPPAGLYGRPRPPNATSPIDNMWAEARSGTRGSQRSRRPPSRSMHSQGGTPLPVVQEMGNMSLGPYLGTPSAPVGPPQSHPVRPSPRPYAMQPNPSIAMDHRPGRQAQPLDSQSPEQYDNETLRQNTPSLSTGYSDSAHGTNVPESPGPMNMPQPDKQYYAPQPRVPTPPRILSDDELALRYDYDRSSPEMRGGPQGTFSPRNNPSRAEY